MNIKSKIAAIALAGIFGLNLPFPIFAKNIRRDADDKHVLAETTVSGRAKVVIGRRVVLAGAKVTGKNGTTLTVNKGGKDYTIFTDANTKFRRKFWGKGNLGEISVNDMVNVIGRWADDGKTQINASLIRNLSVQKRHGTFFGEVKSLTDSGFVMSTAKRGDETVTIDSSTKLVNRKMVTISKSDIQVGHRIRVKGVWDNVNHTITEVSQIKDFSLPLKVTPTPTP